MVRGAEPLVVDVLVAALTGVGFHEELAGNFLLAVDLRGTGEEWAVGAVAFTVHGVGRHGGILNAIADLPAFADVVRAVANGCERDQTDGRAHRG